MRRASGKVKAWRRSRSWKDCRDARRVDRSWYDGLVGGVFVVVKLGWATGALMSALRFRFLPLLVVGAGMALACRRGRVTFKGEEASSSRPTIPLPEQLGSRRREVMVFHGAVRGLMWRKSWPAWILMDCWGVEARVVMVWRSAARVVSRSQAWMVHFLLLACCEGDFSCSMAARWVVLFPGAAQASTMSP